MNKDIVSKLKDTPEQKLVVGPLVEQLINGGWSLGQIIFGKNEWKIPQTPSEASKREKGVSFDYYPVDIAVFDSIANCGDYRHILFIIECKQPKIDVGLQQLETYLSLEPHAKLGIWANNSDISSETLFVYKNEKGIHFPKHKKISDLPIVGSPLTPASVNFTFNHILSRLNISIAKASDLSAAKVTLQSLTINKMKNVGDFDESKVSGTDLSNGTVERWTASGSATISNASDATDLTVTEGKQWIYQGLVIPQTVEVEAINLDGTKSDGEVVAKPYLTINYSISTTSGTVTNTQEYSYNYNLADLFNGDGTGNIDFCEGWQNNLNITIGAGIPIKFDAKVYDWATKVDGSYQVKP